MAKLAESQLREHHRRNLDRLRSVAAPMLARLQSPALAVDAHGWVAAVESVALRNRVPLPPDLTPGRFALPVLGLCDFEALPGGWLVRPVNSHLTSDTAAVGATVTIDLRSARAATVRIDGEVGSWTHEPTPRHAEILFLLATNRGGRTAAQTATDLFGDESRTITVRAEMSRLRKHFSGLLLAQPYRFDESAVVELLLPDDPTRLLSYSSAPAVRAARTHP